MAAKKVPHVVSSPQSIRTAQQFTLAQAFDYFFEPGESVATAEEWNHERAIRAVGFLLHFCSNMGNDAVGGNAANGLGYILERIAGDLTYETSAVRRHAQGRD